MGLYKNYNEFITNSPSLRKDLAVRKKKNLHLHGAEGYTFDIMDGKKVGKVFGFSDGNDIYVQGLRTEGYHKLEFIGPFSYYTFTQSVYSAATAIIPDHLVVIDSTGKYRDGTANYIRSLLNGKDKNLFNAFIKEPNNKDMLVRIKYLKVLNENLIKR